MFVMIAIQIFYDVPFMAERRGDLKTLSPTLDNTPTLKPLPTITPTLRPAFTPDITRDLGPTPTVITWEPIIEYPETIRVRITGHDDCDVSEGRYYKIVEVPFKKYVKTVLAGEWYDTLHPESIKAGAVAVKMNALHAVASGGKWGGAKFGHVYDCDWDMVYNPNLRFEKTDQAVEETWDYILVYEGTSQYYETYFLSGWNGCLITAGSPTSVHYQFYLDHCMGQWNSHYDAVNRDLNWIQILDKWYIGSELIKNVTYPEIPYSE